MEARKVDGQRPTRIRTVLRIRPATKREKLLPFPLSTRATRAFSLSLGFADPGSPLFGLARSEIFDPHVIALILDLVEGHFDPRCGIVQAMPLSSPEKHTTVRFLGPHPPDLPSLRNPLLRYERLPDTAQSPVKPVWHKLTPAVLEEGGTRFACFDAVLGPDASQEETFEASGMRDIVDGVLRGTSGCVMAYGQSGTGKAYSVAGSSGLGPAYRHIAPSAASPSSPSKQATTKAIQGPLVQEGLLVRALSRIFSADVVCLGDGLPPSAQAPVSSSLSPLLTSATSLPSVALDARPSSPLPPAAAVTLASVSSSHTPPQLQSAHAQSQTQPQSQATPAAADATLSGGRRVVAVELSCVQIYLGNITDLCASQSGPHISHESAAAHEDGRRKLRIRRRRASCELDELYVEGLTRVRVSSLEEALVCVSSVDRVRLQQQTYMSTPSCRASSLWTITVTTQAIPVPPPVPETQPNQSQQSTSPPRSHPPLVRARLWCAKFEGAIDTPIDRHYARRSQLPALYNVLYALAKKSRHVPYRDSKLVRLLQMPLSGACPMIFLAHVSPSPCWHSGTHHTLTICECVASVLY